MKTVHTLRTVFVRLVIAPVPDAIIFIKEKAKEMRERERVSNKTTNNNFSFL